MSWKGRYVLVDLRTVLDIGDTKSSLPVEEPMLLGKFLVCACVDVIDREENRNNLQIRRN